MIKNLICIRIRQIVREIAGIGLFRIVVLLGLSCIFLVVLYLQTGKQPNALYTSLAVWFLLLLLHRNRNDKQFLRINFGYYPWIFSLEYLLISLVLLAFLLIHGFWKLALLGIVIPMAIAHTNIGKVRAGHYGKLLQWIPLECFEWRSGMKRTFPLFLAFWLAGIAFSFFVGSVPLAMFLLGVMVLSFYERNEPYPMITALEKNPNGFLALKIGRQIYLFTLLSVPLILSFLIFHYTVWYVPVIIYVVLCILQVYTILVKYAFYEPNSKSLAAQIFMGIGFVGLVIPIFAPLIILFMLRFYIKAKRNLNFYLNDFH